MRNRAGDKDKKADNDGQANNDNADEKQKKIDKLLEDLLNSPLVDFGSARKNVHKLARGSVVEITKKIAAAAIGGNLPAAKYLFEMSGIYPTTDQGAHGIEEGSLAETLLKYLGLPTTLKSDDDDAPASELANETEDETENDPPTDRAEEDSNSEPEEEQRKEDRQKKDGQEAEVSGTSALPNIREMQSS